MMPEDTEALLDLLLASLPGELGAALKEMRSTLERQGVVTSRMNRQGAKVYRLRVRMPTASGGTCHESITLDSDDEVARRVSLVISIYKALRQAARQKAIRQRDALRRERASVRWLRADFLLALRVGRRVRRQAAADFDKAYREAGIVGVLATTSNRFTYEARSRPGRPVVNRYWMPAPNQTTPAPKAAPAEVSGQSVSPVSGPGQ